MKSFASLLATFFASLIPLWGSPKYAAAQAPEAARLPVSVTADTVKSGVENAQIVKGTYRVKPNDSPRSILQQLGITPDNESLGLMLYLNPDTSLAKLPVNTDLVVPTFSSDAFLQKLRTENKTISLNVEPEAKKQLLAFSDEFTSSKSKFNVLADSEFTSTDDAKRVRESLKKSQDFLAEFGATVERRGAIMHPDAIRIAAADAKALETCLVESTSAKKISPEDLSTIYDIGDELVAIGKSIKVSAGTEPPSQTQTMVKVLVLDATGKSLPHYMVYFRGKYEPNGMQQSFSQMTENAIRPMINVTYKFWAVLQNGTQRSIVREQSVRHQPDNGVLTIELPLKP